MNITFEVPDDFFKSIRDAVAEGVRIGNGEAPATPEEIKRTAGDLIKLINDACKNVEPKEGQQNRNIIKAVFAEHGASKVPEVPDNQMGEVYRKIEERRVG